MFGAVTASQEYFRCRSLFEPEGRTVRDDVPAAHARRLPAKPARVSGFQNSPQEPRSLPVARVGLPFADHVEGNQVRQDHISQNRPA
jgi:hypothetical protein